MTGAEFITYVKAKLNRLDTEAYQDVRDEEVLFYAFDALKNLSLLYDKGMVPATLDRETVSNYLASITKTSGVVALVNNKVALPLVLKIKDIRVSVTVDGVTGMTKSNLVDNIKSSDRWDNPFTQSQADQPNYRLIDNEIVFEQPRTGEFSAFTCTMIIYEYLEYPTEITESTVLDMPFVKELQDKTATLILENLESNRVQSQPIVSNS